MFSRMGSAALTKDLTNTRIICDHLRNPQNKFKSIHVGGTNGKGSVSHMLAAIYQTSGYKTGLYTSPHLYDFRERIKLDGEMIPEKFVIDFVQEVMPLIEKIAPSFFEITVAMAFHYFAQQKVDIAIIEAGLGGRLDSTNIIIPELSIITNIGWDHMNILGNSLEEIAAEKAGIIKKNIPVVIGETITETKPVFVEIANKKNASIVFADEVLREHQFEIDDEFLSLQFKQTDSSVVQLKTDLTGIYQVKNVRTVLTALHILRNLNWKFDNVLSALQNVKPLTGLNGRWEVIHKHPTIVLEVAHNKEGIEQMLQHIKQLSFEQLHIIFGTVKDKEVKQILALLPTNALYYFTQAQIPRALPAAELMEKSEAVNLTGETYAHVDLALADALQKAGKRDFIIVCGSIFLVAEVDKHRFQ